MNAAGRASSLHWDRIFAEGFQDPPDDDEVPRQHPAHGAAGPVQLPLRSYPACGAFTVVLLAWLPVWAWLVLPFTLMVALSRLVLGLHYPTDVLAGAAIGATVALISLWGMGGRGAPVSLRWIR
ncbi:PA-phosphatase-like phosphoesterase [Ectothiorhodospira sp. PHS-1]|nr:PA-phosphatase-like phosphoesterase [Ectothiorhodospira sp. PHS-1]